MEKRIRLYINNKEGMLNGIPFFCLVKIFIYKNIFFQYGNDKKEEKAFKYVRRRISY